MIIKTFKDFLFNISQEFYIAFLIYLISSYKKKQKNNYLRDFYIEINAFITKKNSDSIISTFDFTEKPVLNSFIFEQAISLEKQSIVDTLKSTFLNIIKNLENVPARQILQLKENIFIQVFFENNHFKNQEIKKTLLQNLDKLEKNIVKNESDLKNYLNYTHFLDQTLTPDIIEKKIKHLEKNLVTIIQDNKSHDLEKNDNHIIVEKSKLIKKLQVYLNSILKILFKSPDDIDLFYKTFRAGLKIMETKLGSENLKEFQFQLIESLIMQKLDFDNQKMIRNLILNKAQGLIKLDKRQWEQKVMQSLRNDFLKERIISQINQMYESLLSKKNLDKEFELDRLELRFPNNKFSVYLESFVSDIKNYNFDQNQRIDNYSLNSCLIFLMKLKYNYGFFSIFKDVFQQNLFNHEKFVSIYEQTHFFTLFLKFSEYTEKGLISMRDMFIIMSFNLFECFKDFYPLNKKQHTYIRPFVQSFKNLNKIYKNLVKKMNQNLNFKVMNNTYEFLTSSVQKLLKDLYSNMDLMCPIEQIPIVNHMEEIQEFLQYKECFSSELFRKLFMLLFVLFLHPKKFEIIFYDEVEQKYLFTYLETLRNPEAKEGEEKNKLITNEDLYKIQTNYLSLKEMIDVLKDAHIFTSFIKKKYFNAYNTSNISDLSLTSNSNYSLKGRIK